MTPASGMKTALAAGVVVLFAAAPALAHPGHGGASFGAGLLHPLSGVDHILAMTAVGLLAAKRGGKALMLWPAAFIAAMMSGYGLGLMNHGAVSLEPGVLASVIVLGVLATSTASMPTAPGLGLIGLFGLCHGFAHGAEAPGGAGWAYPIGFAVSTTALHGLGLMLGVIVLKLNRPVLLRFAGAGVALGGIVLTMVG